MKKGCRNLFIFLCMLLLVGCGSVEELAQNSQESETTQSQSEINVETQESETQETEIRESEAQTSEGGESQLQETEKNVSETDTPSRIDALQVIGSQLCDSKGNPVILRGLSTHGIAWFPDYINEAAFQEFHEEWGINVIRLAMYTAEYNGYCTGGNQEWLKSLVKNGVEYATKNDMYVIIDWHVLNDNNPQTYKSEAINFFREMSAEFADHNNVIYEICNEPCNGTSWQDIKSYAEEVIPVIRANDSDAIIIVGTPNWSQNVGDAVKTPITGYDNIMYALHFYAATHTDWLRNNMVEAIEAGLPIFVTEYGICDASGNGAIDENQAKKWIDIMNENGVSYCGWNISNKSETSAIFKADCTKTSGWTTEDLSASGKWMYEMLRKWNLGE